MGRFAEVPQLVSAAAPFASSFEEAQRKRLHSVAPFYQTTQPDWFDELTEAQQTVLEPAYIYNHPLLENDGETVDRESRTEPKQFSYQRQMAGRSS